MNPVISYKDFTDYLKWNVRDTERFIPVLLISPDTVLSLNQSNIINNIFDYMDRRTGEGIQFFLPGYVHYPNTNFKPVFPDWSPYNENTIAIRINRLGNIHYSNKAFIDFIDILEKFTPRFRYRGDTELLFIKYIPSNENLDYKNIRRYDLTYLFNCIQLNYRDDRVRLINIRHFLEDVIYTIRSTTDETEMFQRIDIFYNRACGGNG